MVDLMQLGVETPQTVIDVAALDLARIEPYDDGLRIGALAKNSDVAHHPEVGTNYPALRDALLSGASPQVRNIASVSGNLLQRTRCPYFRDTSMPCNKRKPGSGCSALEGFNRMHAVLGVTDACIATHPSDMCVALVALDAIVRVRGAAGERAIPIETFHLLPREPHLETTLAPRELITQVDIPRRAFSAHSSYVKVRDRAAFDFALASAAAALHITDGTIKSARVALGGVATKPWRSHEAEAVLEGRAPSAELFAAAARAALRGAQPRKYNAFKIELANRTIVRALEKARGTA
jgi:xanthine dehydrogenase YagS FAD-binding subunit